MARGGKRTPRNPAPVSTPQSGARTDGGAGSAKQPLRDMPMDAHGERAALEQLQGAAPMNAAQPAGVPGPAPTAELPNPFAPTERPNEPITAGLRGAPSTPQYLPPDPDELVRILYSIYPHPDIGRLIR